MLSALRAQDILCTNYRDVRAYLPRNKKISTVQANDWRVGYGSFIYVQIIIIW
jgi:hypothetical protein